MNARYTNGGKLPVTDTVQLNSNSTRALFETYKFHACLPRVHG